MLNIASLHDPHYHLKAVTYDATAYYLRGGEAPGRWAGQGATQRGLAGEVGPGDLVDLFAGKDPATGTWLISARGSAARARDRAGQRHLWTDSAAGVLGLSAAQVRARLRAGELAGVKDGRGRWQVPVSAIDAYLDGRRQPRATALPAPGADGLYSTTDVAAIVGCSRQYLDRIVSSAAPEPSGRESAAGSQYLLGVRDERGRWRVAPAELERFIATRRSPEAVPAYDLALRAPKSVSLLHDLGHLVPAATMARLGQANGVTVATEVAGAHRAAVEDVVAFLESHAAYVRTHDGREQACGLTVAVFDHRCSREGGPLLHSHLVVINAATGIDGTVGALDGATLYQFARAGGHLYQARLRHELTRRLGVRWHPPNNGVADLVGVPREVIEAFSVRSRQIARHLEAIGRSDARAAQAAALATRRPKDPERGVAPEETARQAASLGFGAPHVARLVGHEPLPPLSPERLAAVAAQLAGPEGLCARRARVDLRDALCALADALPEGTTGTELVALARRLLAAPERFVPVLAGPAGREVLRRKDGRTVRAGVALQKFSTPELLAQESRLLSLVAQGRGPDDNGVRWGIATPAALAGALGAHPHLNDEQLAMLRRVTTSGWGIDVVVGGPGSGKTSVALAAASAAWAASGLRVIGTSTQGGAAQQLRAGARLAEAQTLASLLRRCEREGPATLRAGVVVVDEAGMADTRQLAMLAAHAHVARAKLVLIGDPDQIPEVGAGGALAALVESLGDEVVVLRANQRQRHRADRERLESLRTGDAGAAVASYAADGLWRSGPSADATREALVRAWWADAGRPGVDKVMAAPTVAEVEWLNRAARALRKAHGELGGETLTIELAAPDRAVDRREFAVGDEVMAQRNWPARGIYTGQRAMVMALDPAAGSLTVRLHGDADADDHERLVVLDRSYLRDRPRPGRPRAVPVWERPGLTHAYASTANGVQGLTTETAYNLATPATYNQAAYVLASRARERTTWFALEVADPDEIEPLERHEGDVDPDQLADLGAAMNRDGSQTMAIRDDPRAAAAGELMRRPTAWLWAERGVAEARLGQAVPALRESLRRINTALAGHYGLDPVALECDPLTRALTRCLRVPGATVERIFELALTRGRRAPRELASAEDPVAVLVWAASGDILARLRAAGTRPAAGSAGSENADTAAQRERIALLDSAIGRQRIGRLELARLDPTGPAQLMLGPPPPEAAGLRSWRRAAAAVLDYRDAAGIYDEVMGGERQAAALGTRPAPGPLADHYDQVVATVARSRTEALLAAIAGRVPPAGPAVPPDAAAAAERSLSDLRAELVHIAPPTPDALLLRRMLASSLAEQRRVAGLLDSARRREDAFERELASPPTRRRRSRSALADAAAARSDFRQVETEHARAVASVAHYDTLIRVRPQGADGRRATLVAATTERERLVHTNTLVTPPSWLRHHLESVVATGDPSLDVGLLADAYGEIAVYRERWELHDAPLAGVDDETLLGPMPRDEGSQRDEWQRAANALAAALPSEGIGAERSGLGGR